MKGILFKPDMIKAIVESKKTQTRRVIKPQPPEYCDRVEVLKTGTWNFYRQTDPDFHAYLKGKPRYQVGEVVYIKEAYSTYGVLNEKAFYKDEPDIDIKAIAWHNPRGMPAWAARYFIQILDVTPQRLQEITEEDAIAEGCDKEIIPGIELPSAKRRYSYLWDSINPDYPWASNPWVWRYTFKSVPSPIKDTGGEK